MPGQDDSDPNTPAQADAFQSVMLDGARGQVVVAGRAVKLTAKEMALLRLLIDHAGQLCPKVLIGQRQ